MRVATNSLVGSSVNMNRHARRRQAALHRSQKQQQAAAPAGPARWMGVEDLESRILLSLTATIDYSFDTNEFFNTDLRRELMQAAVNMVVRDFTDTLDAISPNSNNTWTADFTHPGDGTDVSEPNLSIAANEIVIYVGGRDLGGQLGEGGPGGFSISFFDQNFANAVIGRGEPGALGAQASQTDFASWGGSITFDNTASWRFGFSTDGLDAGENDFLSVAMHEVAHLLGFGTSASFQNLINFGNATFTGAQSVVANGGSPVPLANAGHWLNGIQSGAQEAAMDPDLTVGTRKVMTPLDNAALGDIGWVLQSTPGVVTNTNDAGPGSLRQAILDLNAGIVPVDTIIFNINVNDPGFIDIDSGMPNGDADADVFQFSLSSELPDITRPGATIDGGSQNAYLASDLNANGPEIWIRGGAVPNASNTNGLTLDAASIFITELAISGFDSNFSAGIFVTTNADDATISRNYLGVDPTGLIAEANDNGVFVDGADNVRINGDQIESPQVISGNNSQGVFITNDATNTRIQGNFIGVGRNGDTNLGNSQHGVSIRSGSGHFVGTDGDGNADLQEGNTIGGNAIEGVHIEGASGVTIAGNRIGTDGNEFVGPLPNQFGISIIGPNSTGNFIGIENNPDGRNIISGNTAEGIRILGGATGNTIVGNFIGTNITGDVAIPNGGLAGVLIEASDGNIVGTVENGNVISGNDADGILLRAFDGDGADNNSIIGNHIGIAADGVSSLGNGARGVAIFNSSGNSVGTVGGVSFSNVISGNAQEGVAIFDEDQEGETLSATNNTIVNNFIGTNRDGIESLGNGGAGVLIEAGDLNTVGGFNNGESGDFAGNVIVNNAGEGVLLTRQANSNSIFGNFIGVTPALELMGNVRDGVAIHDSNSNLVGTDAVGSENFIGGNVGTGVSIIDFLPFVGVAHAGPANFNVVVNNFIGTDTAGTQDLGNALEGVYISAGSNTVGQVDSFGQSNFRNIIAFNGTTNEPGIAVSIVESAAFGIVNSLRGNTIFSNSGIAIDLADVNGFLRFDGVTPNDFLDGDSGPNTLQNFPVITTANATGPSLTVAGTLNTNIASGQYLIDIYADGRHIGQAPPTAEAGGFANFNVTFPNANVSVGQIVTATATRMINPSTSEHSAGFAATADIVPFDVVVESTSFFSNAVNPFFDVFIDAPAGVVAAITGYNIGLRISPAGSGVTLNAPIAGNDPLIAGTPDLFNIDPQVLVVADDVSSGTVAIVDDKDFFRVPITIAPGTVGTFSVTIDPASFQLSDGQGVELDSSLFNLINGTITITAPTLEVSIGDPVPVTEGNVAVNFPVTLSANPTSTVTVTVSTANNTAVAGDSAATGTADYTTKTQTFIFNPGGALTQNFNVNILSDTVKEPNETFFANITGTTGPVTSVTDSQGVATINDNDTLPAILVTDVTLTEGDTAKKEFIFTVNLTAAHGTSNVSVNFATANVSAVAGSDYDANSGTLTFGPTETSKNISVKVNGDFTAESNETFQLNFSSPVNATLPDAQAIGTITNDDTRLLNIDDVSIAEGDTGTKQMVFTVSLNEPAGPSGVSVNFATFSDTAVAPDDFIAQTGSLAFASGETAKTISITINGDFTAEANETFIVELSSLTGADFAVNGNQGTGTILNDDTRFMTIDDVSVSEGDTGTKQLVFNVTLNEPAGPSGVGVNFTTQAITADAPADFVAQTGSLTFAPGESAKTISITINGDINIEADETFAVDLSSLTGADFAVNGNQGIGTILNDDVASISIGDVTQAEGNGPGTTAFTFNVTLSADPTAQVQVTAFTADGSATLADGDYQQLAGTPINFLPGGPLTQQVTVLVNGDIKFEAEQTFTLNLTGLTGPATISDGSAVGTIDNDDSQPTISIDDVALAEGLSGTTAFTFTVSLSNPSDAPISVQATTADGSALVSNGDYQSNSQTLNFAAGVTSQQFTVLVNGDNIFELDENFTVDLSDVIGSAVIGDGQGAGTIVNDEAIPSVSISDVTRLEDEGFPGPTNYLFTLSLDRASAFEIRVDFTTSDGTATLADQDYPAAGATIVFQAGQTVRQFIVAATPDTQFEPDESFFVDLFNPVNVTIGDSRGEAVILNDDGVPSISVNDVSHVENQDGTTEFTFTVSLSNSGFLPISVDFQVADGTATVADGDYQSIAGTLNFPSGFAAPQTQTVTVLVNGDVRFERDETFVRNLVSAVNATIADGQGAGTIANDDTAPGLNVIGGSVLEGNVAGDNRVVPFTLQLSAVSGVDVTGTLSVVSDSATLGVDFADITGQTFTIPAGTTEIIVNVPVIEDTNIEGDETFQLTATANDPSTLSPSNIGGAASGTGTIQNDDFAAPTFTITDVTANEGDIFTNFFTFTVTLSGTVLVPALVTLNTADGSAKADPGDYEAISGMVLNFAAAGSQTVTVEVNGDTKFEADETFSVNLTNATGGAVISDGTGVGTIVNDDNRPTIMIANRSASEGDELTFSLVLSNLSDEVVTVLVSTVDGSATVADGDYVPVGGQLITFDPETNEAEFVVQTIEDNKLESNETLTVVLSSATNATGVSGSPATGTIVNDDGQPVVSISGPSSVVEGTGVGGVATYTVALTNPSFQTITVVLNTADGSATAGSDYTGVAGQTVTFTPGQTSQQVNVAITGDAINENDETFSAAISTPTNATINAAAGSVTTTIIDDDGAPTLSIDDVAEVETDAGTTAFVFTVTLSGSSASPITVNFATSDGSATVADGDYQSNAGTLTFNPGGPATQTVTVLVNGDTRFETNQTFNITLSNAANASISDAIGQGTITNDDARPTITIAGASASEGDALTFNLTLSNLSDEQVSVLATTVNGSATAGSDFTGVANQLVVFAPGAGAAQLVVASTEDGTVETAETFTVELSGAVNAGGVSGSPATGTIVNDDGVTTISVNDVAVAEGNAGSTKLDFTITLSAPSSQTITVLAVITDGTATAGEDYTASTPVLVTFTPGSTVRTVSANVLGDTKFEADQTFTITLSDATNAVIADGAGTATILNDDARPTVTIRNANNNEGNQLTFGIELSHATDETVTLTASTNDGSATVADGAYVAGSDQPVSFAPGQLLTTVVVQTNEDDTFESDETLTVLLKNLVGGTFGDDTGAGTILNDDALPAISIADKTVTETDGVSVELIQLSLSNPSAFPVSVVVDTVSGGATAGSDFGAIVGRIVTFNPGQTSITTPVNILGDTIRENNEGFLVSLSSPIGGTIADGQAGVLIQDNDPLPTISINDVTQNEGTGGTTAFTFTVSLSNGSQNDVLVTLTVNDGSATVADGDYIDGGTVMTFQNGGPLSQTFTVLVNGDAIFEGNETFAVNLSGAANAVIAAGDAGVGTGTILNDDGMTVSISDGQSVEGNVGDNHPIVFNVSLSAPPTELMTVNLGSFNGSATTADDDYLPLNTFLVFLPGGPTTQQVSVQVVGDDFFEFDETLEVRITNVAGSGATIADGTGIGTILNDDLAPTVSIGDVSRPEDFGVTSFFLGFPVTLSKPIKVPVTVSVAFNNGTATEGSDWADDFGSNFTFVPGGSTTVLFGVSVFDDNIFELDETVLATITGATNAAIADGTAVGTIVNDDAAPTLSIANASVQEGDAGESNDLVFNVTLSHPSHETISIAAILGGTAIFENDYNDAVSATIPAGTTTGTVRVRTIGDNRFELDETVLVEPLLFSGNAVLGTTQAVGTILNDDNAPVITIGNGSVLEGNAGEITFLSIPVSISGETDVSATVTLNTFDGTATSSGANRDYDGGSIAITFTPGGPTAFEVLHNVRGDNVFEGNETFTVVASNVTNATVAGTGIGVGTIIDDEPAPTVSIGDTSVLEDSGFSFAQLSFPVTLSSAVSVPVTMTFVATAGTATPLEDFIAGSVTVTFNPGDPLTKQVVVLVEHDNIFEADETVIAKITSATNATIADGTAVGTIINDDAKPVVSIADATALEGNTGQSNNLVFNVTLSNPSDQDIAVDVLSFAAGSAILGSDYELVQNALIPAGATAGTIVVRTFGDNRFERNEFFFIFNVGIDPAKATFDGQQPTGTILNDDAAPVITIGNGSVLEGDAGETTGLRIPVSITGETDVTATITLNTFDGTATGSGSNRDYDNDSLPLVLTFTPGGPTTFDVLHTVRGDNLVEGNETFALVASDVTNATVASTSAGVGTIIDDDLPTIRISDVTLDEDPFLLASHDFTFLVELSQPATQTITVDFATVNGSATTADGDYAAKSGTITFTPGTDFALVKVTVFADDKFEQDQDFFVNLSNLNGATFADPQGKGTIRNDDQRPTITIDDAGNVTEGNSGTTPAFFSIRLSNPSDEVVSVNASTADGSATSADNDFNTVNSLPIVFNPGQTQLLAVALARGDAKFELDQTFRMVLTGASNASGISDGEGLATIVNDDNRPTISIEDAPAVTEGLLGTVQALFTVRLSNPSDEVVTVRVDTADGTATDANNDYEPLVNQTLTFNTSAPGASLTQTVVVTVNGDANVEPDETFIVNISSSGNATLGVNSATGTITNDDVAQTPLTVQTVTINDGSAQRSSVTQLTVVFSIDANIQALITSGQIADAVRVVNTTTNAPVPLAADRYLYNAATRTLTIDLNGLSVSEFSDTARFQLRLDTTLITQAGNPGNPLVDSDGTSDAIHRFSFHQLKGDFDGNARVDSADQAIFQVAYGALIGSSRYRAFMDFNGDGRIDQRDLLVFRRQLGIILP